MKNKFLSLTLLAGLCTAMPVLSQVGQDVKDAAHDTKTASEKGYDKSTHAVKKGYKKSTHGTKKGVHKAADKVSDKTTT